MLKAVTPVYFVRKAIAFIHMFFVRFVFYDAARPVEFISMTLFANWAVFFLFLPETDSAHKFYEFFDLSAWRVWTGVFGFVTLLHLAAIALPFRYTIRPDIRFFVLVIAAALWCVIAVSFWSSGMSTTAEWNYTILSFSCAITGLYVLWTPIQIS